MGRNEGRKGREFGWFPERFPGRVTKRLNLLAIGCEDVGEIVGVVKREISA